MNAALPPESWALILLSVGVGLVLELVFLRAQRSRRRVEGRRGGGAGGGGAGGSGAGGGGGGGGGGEGDAGDGGVVVGRERG